MSMSLPSVLTIAGSDSSGGAGIQADLKTIAAYGLYGSSAITSITAQNTTGVYQAEAVSPELLAAQLEAVFSDIPPGAVKIGMAGTAASIETIAAALSKYSQNSHSQIPVVLDPVMVATSGSKLLEENATQALIALLFPVATLITPNLPEAETLLGFEKGQIKSSKDMEAAARELSARFHASFLLKGGHHGEKTDDLLCCDRRMTWFPGTRIDNPNTHGTGCTLSSAIACGLAKGLGLEESIQNAKKYVRGALKAGLNLGKGSGPLWHGWRGNGNIII